MYFNQEDYLYLFMFYDYLFYFILVKNWKKSKSPLHMSKFGQSICGTPSADQLL